MVFIGVILKFAYLTSQEYRHIVRILGNDIPGAKKVHLGLTQIKGIGYSFSNAILGTLKIDVNSNIGYLTDSQVQSIEQLIKDPKASGFPTWFLNRRKDIETGQDMHLFISDIPFTVRNDVEREKQSYSWRGYRHLFGLKVRGQCTRTTGRKGGAVGVAKGGKAQPGQAAPAEGAAPAAAAPAAAAPAAAKPAAAPKKEEKK